MTDHPLDELTVDSEEAFHELLTALLERAEESGVDVLGAYECPNDGETTDWEVLVTDLLNDRD